MGPLIAIIAILAIFSIPLSAIIGSYYLKLQRLKMQQQGDPEAIRDLRKEVGYLMAENEEIKERLKNLEYIQSEDDRRINWKYEQEQIKLDKDNKYNS